MKKQYILFGLAGLFGSFLQNGTITSALGITAPAGVMSSEADLRALMEKDAASMVAKMREVSADAEDSGLTVPMPEIDVAGRLIDFKLVVEAESVELGSVVIDGMVHVAKTSACPKYQDTLLSLNDVTLRYRAFYRDGTPFFSYDVNPAICAEVLGG